MTKRQQAEIILQEVNEQYTIPTYMEDFVMKGILTALTKIELEEKKEGEQYGKSKTTGNAGEESSNEGNH